MPDIGLAKYRELQVLAGCPSTYTPPLFFTRYCRAFLPPYFADTADKISEKTKINFTQLWGWECERLMTSLSISQETGDVSSYTGGGRRGNLAGAFFGSLRGIQIKLFEMHSLVSSARTFVPGRIYCLLNQIMSN